MNKTKFIAEIPLYVGMKWYWVLAHESDVCIMDGITCISKTHIISNYIRVILKFKPVSLRALEGCSVY